MTSRGIGLLRGVGGVSFGVALVASVAGCESPVSDEALSIGAAGVVQGAVFVDLNGNGQLDLADGVLPGLSVQVVQAPADGVVASGTTDPFGVFVIGDVPVGRFTIGVDDGTLPDSLVVQGLGTVPFVLGAGDTVTVSFRTSFPTHPLSAVGGLPPDTRIFTSGFALNPRNPAGDGAVHLSLGGSYLRATGVDPATIAVGDSVRFSGVTSLEAGLPVLSDVRVFVLRQLAAVPAVLERSTLGASTADGGVLNAALVRVRQADVVDTTFVGGDLVATLDDGSGPVDLVIRGFLGIDGDGLSPGFSRLTSATGLLVAEPQVGGGLAWRLLPRFGSDLSLESFPLRTVAEARALPAGVGVTVRGVVLNPVDGPVPGTIHLEEDGSYIRVRAVSGVSPAVGDTLQVRARTARSVFQPVLDALQPPVVMGGGPVSPPQLVPPPNATLTAGNANAGGADAALVRLQNVTIASVVADDGAGNFIATLNDGSGPVDLVISPASGVPTAGLTPATVLTDVVGLLVPRLDLGVPEWRIFARSPADVVP